MEIENTKKFEMKKIYVFDSESGKVVERKKPNFIEIPEVENELIEKVFGKFFVEMFCSKSTFDLEFVTVLGRSGDESTMGAFPTGLLP